ncbi:MAG: alternate-type signal peptide domain-containing protein [Microbacteriaceae bacterium]
MNKLVKGAIATAAGIALLMGGAGTLAFWSDAENITGGTITAGNLDISTPATAPATDGWKSGTTAINLATYKIIPGSTITYTKTFNVTAVGNGLTATAALGNQSIAGTTTSAADVALANRLTKTAAFTVGGVSTSTVSAAAGTQTVVVTVSITFTDGTAVVDNPAKLGSVNLSNFDLTLTQTV